MVTGKDMGVFIDKWIRAGGHAQFHMDFFFNRKRNTVEMNITQVRNSPLIDANVMSFLLDHRTRRR